MNQDNNLLNQDNNIQYQIVMAKAHQRKLIQLQQVVDKSDIASENLNTSELDIDMNESIRESRTLINIKEKNENIPDYRFIGIELNDDSK